MEKGRVFITKARSFLFLEKEGIPVTLEQALWRLSQYGREPDIYVPSIMRKPLWWNNIEYKRSIYEAQILKDLANEMIRSNREPIAIVEAHYEMMDRILCESDEDAIITHEFAALCQSIYHDILIYFKRGDIE